MSTGRFTETTKKTPHGSTVQILRARVKWKRGGVMQSIVLERPAVVGASPESNLVVDDPLVSRVHMEIDPRADGVWVRDLGSTNGTWIGSVRVERGIVPDRGTVRVGETELHVDYHTSQSGELWPDDRFGRLVGRSAKMRELFATIDRVGPTNASVLIHGETGTGKELVARAIHDASPRADRPFVIVDCGALAETLLDAELFGHAKGAFTGAANARAGAVEEAAGGTLFLDEIGELPMALQPKLLRALESHSVRRLGETHYREVDVRFVAATHRGLLDMVASGEFREDLYFRLAVLPIFIPPLRERREDIALLAQNFLAGATDKSLSDELLESMTRRMWRGNVRELRNFVERVRTLGASEALALAPASERAPNLKMESRVGDEAALSSSPHLEAAMQSISLDQPYKPFREAWIEQGERAYFERLNVRAPQAAAAVKAAGLERTYLYRLLRKYTR